MKNKTEILVTIIFVSFFIFPLFARDFFSNSARSFERPPEPRLVYPVSEVVYLSGDSLNFKWWHADIGIDRFEFILYKGSGMPGDSVIFKKTLPSSISTLPLEAGLFENNQTYTWSLQQVTDSGLKSEKSFITFRVIKK